jgi:hypothetical protein
VRVRIYVVAIGLIVGITLKWGLASLTASNANSLENRPYANNNVAQKAALVDPHADPLVPPAVVPGLPPKFPTGFTPQPANPSALLNMFGHDPRALFHAHGQKVCASGCAASNHPTETLTKARFKQLMSEFSGQPIDETSLAYETLLYYGRQTSDLISSEGFGKLDPLRARALWHELTRTHALIAIRVVDEFGEVRTSLPPTKVPFDRRHVFDMDTNRVQPLVTSGTVKRVGLYHLWTRL